MYSTLIVPLDGSAFAEQAIPFAAAIACRRDAKLVLVRVHDTRAHLEYRTATWMEFVHDEENAYLERRAVQLLGAGCADVSWRVLDGNPAATIASCAAAVRDSLIVMSTHGRTGIRRSWLGSVADAVTHLTSAPVLLVHPQDDAPPDEPSIADILVALDGSSLAEAVLPHAASLATIFEAELLLFRVTKAPGVPRSREYLRAVAALFEANHPAVRVRTQTRVGETPGAAILAQSRRLGAPMIALASHGRGVSRFVLGSVADDILRGGSRTVLLLRSPPGVSPTAERQTPAANAVVSRAD